LGSIRELIDATGAIRARYAYSPLGMQWKVSGDIDTDPRGKSACNIVLLVCLGAGIYYHWDDIFGVDECREAAERAKPEIDKCPPTPEDIARRRTLEQQVREACVRPHLDEGVSRSVDFACGAAVVAFCVAPKFARP